MARRHGLAKLMFIAPSAYVLGGVQIWLDYIVQGLIERGHEVVVGLVSGRFHDVDAYLQAHPFRDVRQIPNTTGSQEGRVRSLCSAIERGLPELVLSVNIADVYPAVARLKLKGHDVRVAMTLHGIQTDYFEDAVNHADVLDGIVCTNKLVLECLRANALPPCRIHYAPYGVEAGNRESRAITSGRPLRIAYVGRFDQPQKRVLDIPEIARRLDESNFEYELRLVGAGPAEDELRKRMEGQVRTGRARFLGELTLKGVFNEVYGWADALLLTSSWETGPIVIWEAMSHKVAVVTSSYVGSTAEGSLRHKYNCLMFPVGDCEAAADAIRQLEQTSLRAQIVDGGHKLIEKQYSRSASIDAWVEAVKQILRSPVQHPQSNPKSRPMGRLDRLLGTSIAETVRRLAKVRFSHRSAGAEWPHSHSSASSDEQFLRRLADMELHSTNARTEH